MSRITLGSNIASLRGQRQLSETSNTLATTFERLSSGQRINKASDDAAGLAVSQSLLNDRRVFTQGIRNLNDGLSLLNIADSSVENLSNIVIRLEELATQSANGALGTLQRKSLNEEAQALSAEYFRISKSTEFNGLSLFDGSFQEVRLQAGYGTDGGIASGLGGALGDGTFRGQTTYKTEESSSDDVTLGDLNGDGILDLVTLGNEFVTQAYTTVMIGLGDGTFGSAASYTVAGFGTYGDGLELGDLNGDGILDIVTATYDGSSGYATVRLGTGDGTFGSATTYLADSGNSYGLVLGDINGDGAIDVVTVGDNGSNRTATVRLGAGDGTLGASQIFVSTIAGIFSSAALGDVNGDGTLDLVAAAAKFSVATCKTFVATPILD